MTLTQILAKLKSLVYSKTETDNLLGNKAASSHTHSDYVPRSGGAVLTADSLGRTVSTYRMVYCGGADNISGASVTLYGKDSDSLAGVATIQAYNGTNNTYLRMFPTGEARYVNNGTTKNVAMKEDTIPRGGGEVLSGSRFSRTVNNDELQINGGTGWGQGASIALGGKDKTGNTGAVFMHAHDATSYNQIEVWPNGSVVQNLNGTVKHVAIYENVIPRSLGSVMDNGELGCKNNTGVLAICSGTDSNHGGNIVLYGCALGSDDNAHRGAVALYALLSVHEYKCMFLHPNGTWSWDGTACQITSDQRLKQQIAEIDDKLLDAWEDVELVQFKYNEAVEQKGDNARLHTGYVVQQIDEACKSHNLDISAYGLYCHEEYPEETEEVEVEQEDGTKTKERKVIREASEHYSLRYTETLVVECAFLRREVKRLSERLSKLEQPSTSEK